ncbi:MAG TPA: zeta toxin family protein [Terracidiphilus sp.]|nr:zeta toxin family protein [Terracidiphilus sp.]
MPIDTAIFGQWLDSRPIIVALAGPNGAGKSTFYDSFLTNIGLRFVNADVLSLSLQLDPYVAAELANSIRNQLIDRHESFIFETVFSDPAGEKLEFLKKAEDEGYTVVLIFIGIDGVAISDQRVSMRVASGGHDVPREKLRQRFSRTMENVRRALNELKNVMVFDHSDLAAGYRAVLLRQEGEIVWKSRNVPRWLKPLLRKG